MIEINPSILAVQVITFLIALGILWKGAWGPLTRLLVERREKIKNDLESAESARRQMEELKASYEKELASIQARAQELLGKAREEGETVKSRIVRDAQDESRKILDKARADLEEESRKALSAVRSEAARLSIAMAEKLLRKSLDRKSQDEFLKDALKDLEKHSGELH